MAVVIENQFVTFDLLIFRHNFHVQNSMLLSDFPVN